MAFLCNFSWIITVLQRKVRWGDQYIIQHFDFQIQFGNGECKNQLKPQPQKMAPKTFEYMMVVELPR